MSKVSSNAVNKIVNFIGVLEGTVDHVDHLGLTTKAYGLVNDMANNPSATITNRKAASSLGFELTSATPEQCKKIVEFIFNSLENQLSKELPNWSSLSDEGKVLVLDAKYNTGVTYKKLSKAIEDYEKLLAKVVRQSRRLSQGNFHKGLDNRAAKLLAHVGYIKDPMDAKNLGLDLTDI